MPGRGCSGTYGHLYGPSEEDSSEGSELSTAQRDESACLRGNRASAVVLRTARLLPISEVHEVAFNTKLNE